MYLCINFDILIVHFKIASSHDEYLKIGIFNFISGRVDNETEINLIMITRVFLNVIEESYLVIIAVWKTIHIYTCNEVHL